MTRAVRIALLFLCLCALVATPPALAKKKRPAVKRHPEKTRRTRPYHPRLGRLLIEHPAGPPTMIIEAVDLDGARAVVRLSGIRHEPAARHFTLHDDRDRHFIALESRCLVEGVEIHCEIGLPPGYLKHGHVQGFTVNADGRDIAAPIDLVAERFHPRPLPAQATPGAFARADGGVVETKPPSNGGNAAQPAARPARDLGTNKSPWIMPRRDGGSAFKGEPKGDTEGLDEPEDVEGP